MVTYCEVHASEDEIVELRTQLENTVKQLQDKCGVEETEGDRRYRLTVVFFPLDRMGETRPAPSPDGD